MKSFLVKRMKSRVDWLGDEAFEYGQDIEHDLMFGEETKSPITLVKAVWHVKIGLFYWMIFSADVDSFSVDYIWLLI